MDYIKHTIIPKIYKKRLRNSVKGDFGRILCIAGSEDYAGAASLSANAALSTLRTGVDIVTIVAPEKVAYAINSLTPDIISKKIKGTFFSKEHVDQVLDISDDFDCILIGPGIGQRDETFIFINEIINIIKVKIINFIK